MQDLVNLGTGCKGVDVADAVEDSNQDSPSERFRLAGFLDDDEAAHDRKICGIPVIGPFGKSRELKECRLVNGVGSRKTFWKKAEIITETGVALERVATMIHPSASVSKFVEIGRGTVLLQNVTVNARTH